MIKFPRYYCLGDSKKLINGFKYGDFNLLFFIKRKEMFGFQTFGKHMMQMSSKCLQASQKYNYSRSLAWSNMYLK